jgi:hypothetical protein
LLTSPLTDLLDRFSAALAGVMQAESGGFSFSLWNVLDGQCEMQNTCGDQFPLD